MTPEQIQEIEQDLEKISPAWAIPGTAMTKEDYEFTIKSPERIKALVREVKRLKKEIEHLKTMESVHIEAKYNAIDHANNLKLEIQKLKDSQ